MVSEFSVVVSVIIASVKEMDSYVYELSQSEGYTFMYEIEVRLFPSNANHA